MKQVKSLLKGFHNAHFHCIMNVLGKTQHHPYNSRQRFFQWSLIDDQSIKWKSTLSHSASTMPNPPF